MRTVAGGYLFPVFRKNFRGGENILSECKGRIKVKVEVTAYAPCPIHLGKSTQFCGCLPIVTGHSVDEYDLETTAFMQLVMTNILAGGSQSIKDTGGTSRTIANNSAASALTIVAGSGTTTPTVADYALASPIAGASGYTTSVTVGSLSESGSSGSCTVTGTISNTSGGNLTYGEIGLEVTVSTYVFLICHDLTNGASGYVVSNNGTLACTYTISNS
jgi:hypothetical protein